MGECFAFTWANWKLANLPFSINIILIQRECLLHSLKHAGKARLSSAILRVDHMKTLHPPLHLVAVQFYPNVLDWMRCS
jgi:hypothetical protein